MENKNNPHKKIVTNDSSEDDNEDVSKSVINEEKY